MDFSNFAAYLSDKTLMDMHSDLVIFVTQDGDVPHDMRAEAERARRTVLESLQERVNGADCVLFPTEVK